MAITNTLPGWVNGDGLRVKFPADEKVLGTAGTFNAGIGHQHVTEFDIDFATVALGVDATNVYILDYHVVLPSTAVVDKIEFIVGTQWTSASSDVALNFGIVRSSDFTTIVDADGLVDTLAFASINGTPGETTTFTPGSTSAGALMGVQAGIGQDGVVCTFWENHVPTAGTGKLRIYWRG